MEGCALQDTVRVLTQRTRLDSSLVYQGSKKTKIIS